jgi:hypothetical protein
MHQYLVSSSRLSDPAVSEEHDEEGRRGPGQIWAELLSWPELFLVAGKLEDVLCGPDRVCKQGHNIPFTSVSRLRPAKFAEFPDEPSGLLPGGMMVLKSWSVPLTWDFTSFSMPISGTDGRSVRPWVVPRRGTSDSKVSQNAVRPGKVVHAIILLDAIRVPLPGGMLMFKSWSLPHQLVEIGPKIGVSKSLPS